MEMRVKAKVGYFLFFNKKSLRCCQQLDIIMKVFQDL